MDEPDLIGFRKDTARVLQDLGSKVSRKNVPFSVPNYLDKLRFAALIAKHVAS